MTQSHVHYINEQFQKHIAFLINYALYYIKRRLRHHLLLHIGGLVCFTNVSRVLQDILSKFVYCRNRTSYENFKLKLEILTVNVIYGIVYFCEIILESSWNVNETTPRGVSLYLTSSPNELSWGYKFVNVVPMVTNQQC